MPRELTDAPGVLLISPERWTEHFVSKHHYAIALARRGARVLFLNPPDDRHEDLKICPEPHFPGVFVVDGPRVARGLRFMPKYWRCGLERNWLRELERLAGLKISVVWLFENSRFFDLAFAGDRLKIYHQVDLDQDFNPKTAAATADICFCTTDHIRERILPFNPSVHKIHHGLPEVETAIALDEEELARFNVGAIHAVCIGNLDLQYIDVGLLAKAVDEFSGVQFHFVGGASSTGPLRSVLGTASNVHWWGRVDHRKIPTILGFADVLLVAYRASDYPEQLASPHKFMEYFDSGKVIVATYTDEYKDKRHLLEMVDNNQDYLEHLAQVLGHLDRYNDSARMATRKAFASENTYSRQLDRCMSFVEQHGLLSGLPLRSAVNSYRGSDH